MDTLCYYVRGYTNTTNNKRKEIIKMSIVFVPPEEQETTISFSRSETDCIIWTSDTTTMTKLDKLCESAPDNYKVVSIGKIDGKTVNKKYLLKDKTLLSFRTGKIKREFTEEQKKALSDRMKQLKQQDKL